jgi:hypothetical protein
MLGLSVLKSFKNMRPKNGASLPVHRTVFLERLRRTELIRTSYPNPQYVEPARRAIKFGCARWMGGRMGPSRQS